MAKKFYQPPKQGVVGQFIDCIFILGLVYLSLMLPLLTKPEAAAETEAAASEVTWQSLGQNPVMQAQWEKLGMEAADAAKIITNRFDYTIEWMWLAITAVVIIGYFVFLLSTSEKEYRQVIAERFDR